MTIINGRGRVTFLPLKEHEETCNIYKHQNIMKNFFKSIISAMSRKRYYFVSFWIEEKGYCNCTMEQKGIFNIRFYEDYLSNAIGGGKSVILFYRRISRDEHRNAVRHDSAKKNQ